MRARDYFAIWVLAGMLVGCATPASPEAVRGCDRFESLAAASKWASATHTPPRPGLPPPSPRTARAFRSAVHTLYLDATVAQLAADIGFDTVVQVFPWRDLNPEPGRFTWHAADAMVRVTQAHNLSLVVRLDMPPDWARRAADSGLPFDLAAYADFVETVAARYRGYVLGYLIWNEPNLAAEWSRSGGQGAEHWDSGEGWVAEPLDYVGVVGAAYVRIKRADPEALVAAGGLAPTNEISERALDDRDFLRRMYAAGRPDCFDVWAVHDYGYGLTPEADRSINDELNLARVESLREIMTAHADARPVWITELGYTLHSALHPPVSEVEQADYVLGAYRRVRRDWPWIEMLTVWNLSYGRPPEDEMSGFSLVNPDLSPRLVVDVLKAMHAEAQP